MPEFQQSLAQLLGPRPVQQRQRGPPEHLATLESSAALSLEEQQLHQAAAAAAETDLSDLPGSRSVAVGQLLEEPGQFGVAGAVGRRKQT